MHTNCLSILNNGKQSIFKETKYYIVTNACQAWYFPFHTASFYQNFIFRGEKAPALDTDLLASQKNRRLLLAILIFNMLMKQCGC